MRMVSHLRRGAARGQVLPVPLAGGCSPGTSWRRMRRGLRAPWMTSFPPRLRCAHAPVPISCTPYALAQDRRLSTGVAFSHHRLGESVNRIGAWLCRKGPSHSRLAGLVGMLEGTSVRRGCALSMDRGLQEKGVLCPRARVVSSTCARFMSGARDACGELRQRCAVCPWL